MSHQPPHDQWEYIYLQLSTLAVEKLQREINRLGAEGWEAVSITSADKTLGLNSNLMVMKRAIVAPPPPDDLEPAWHPDPCGRFDKRYWDGLAWTAHTGTEADKSTHIDPPTVLTPGRSH